LSLGNCESLNHVFFSLPVAKKYVDVLNPGGKSSNSAMLPSSLLPMMPMPGAEFKGNFFVPSPVNTGNRMLLAFLACLSAYVVLSPLQSYPWGHLLGDQFV